MALDDLTGGPQRRTRPSTCRGRVVVAPADNDDAMHVVLVNYSAAYSYEIPAAQWTSVSGDLPGVGDVCLVVFDDEGDAWVPAWGQG
jgi:hypothetical protein